MGLDENSTLNHSLGLLPLLKSIQKPSHLRQFSGQTLGVDAYGWLHRGAISCAIELAQQKPTRKHIEFALTRVRMLIHFGVKPYLVFDGDYLPSKAHTEKDRATRRKESRRAGLELMSMGRVSMAYHELQKAIDVTPAMARELIEELKLLDVPYVVAPYEADSQLAFLEKHAMIDGVLSEDSDLLVFGVKRLLTKLDQYGECVMVSRADFTACREVSLVGWTDKEFRMMAMLSGCDYLPGIHTLGVKTAYRLVRKHKTIQNIVRTLQFEGNKKVPAGYLEAFTNAERTFLYQWVFCPQTRGLVNLNPVPSDLDVQAMKFLGPMVESFLAAGVASGDLDPGTKEPLPVPRKPASRPTVRNNASHSADQKLGTPITEFFKSKRTPLAELDPNSFTPNPSQQRLLEGQQDGSWSAPQIQPRFEHVANHSFQSTTRPSALQHTRHSIPGTWPRAGGPQLERKRLCPDALISTSGSGGLDVEPSRFFSNTMAQASPSLRKAPSKKKDDFEVWSEHPRDKITEVSKTPSPRNRKKLKVFAYVQSNGAVAVDLTPDMKPASSGQDLVEPTNSVSAQERTVGPVQLSASGNATSKPFTGREASFSCQSQQSPSVASRAGSKAQVLTTPLQETQRKTSLGTTRKSKTGPHESAQTVQSPHDNDHTWCKVLASSPIASASPSARPNNLVDTDTSTPVHRAGQEPADTVTCGSEDLLVPESPEEDAGSPVKLDLGRFVFCG